MYTVSCYMYLLFFIVVPPQKKKKKKKIMLKFALKYMLSKYHANFIVFFMYFCKW